MCRQVDFIAEHVLAVGRFDAQHVAEMQADAERQPAPVQRRHGAEPLLDRADEWYDVRRVLEGGEKAVANELH